ncbi:MAG: Histidine kinase [Verrucomicrobiales bacterium]|nr:Histidine kinase [Verrucomicrobiales bacterium]MDB6131139.1 Histidine kinase [Verrucomicrobiales bacterium]
MILTSPAIKLKPLDAAQIEARVRSCARLPSLSSVNSALRELLHADQRYTSQVAEVIRRDPSLTARILRLVNSVYYGFNGSINTIEEAVFFLGVRQIRQLAMVTPIIEDFQKLVGTAQFRWREFWQHCIGTALLTREIMSIVENSTDEVDYVAGLVHDVGKIVMAAGFPDYFSAIYSRVEDGAKDLLEEETVLLGINHADLGALYLKHHNLPEVMVEAARYHHEPELCVNHQQVVAAVQIADLLVREAKIKGNEDEPPAEELWLTASGWKILCPNAGESERKIIHASLKRSMDRLPTILEGLV